MTMTLGGGEHGNVSIRAAHADIVKDSGSSKLYAYVDFDPKDATTDTITLRLAASFISAAQAETSLAREIGNKTFDQVMAESKAIVRRRGMGTGGGTCRARADAGCAASHRSLFFPASYSTQFFPRSGKST